MYFCHLTYSLVYNINNIIYKKERERERERERESADNKNHEQHGVAHLVCNKLFNIITDNVIDQFT